MEYISSDTNVWLDFATINRLEIPFLLGGRDESRTVVI